MSKYFPKIYKAFQGNVKIELDLYNHITKFDLKGTMGVDTSNVAAKSDLASLKA